MEDILLKEMVYSRIIYFVLIAVGLMGSLLFYLKVARSFGVLDKPTGRSSHNQPTIRGGGVVFVVATWIWFVLNDFSLPYFIGGVTLIALVSFMDDVISLRPVVRFVVHVVAFLFFLVQLPGDQPLWITLLIVLISLGALNAFNFMDGINGITGIYALVSLVTFIIINEYKISFVHHDLLVIVSISVVIFLFFNFRKKAVCFAGDIGSVTLAFVQIFIVLSLIYQTNNYSWVFLFLVFGMDSVITILYRLKNRENIFKPHRSHLYQYLSNEWGLPQRLVSVLYGLVQAITNLVLVLYINESIVIIGMVALVVILYVALREFIIKSKGLTSFFS